MCTAMLLRVLDAVGPGTWNFLEQNIPLLGSKRQSSLTLGGKVMSLTLLMGILAWSDHTCHKKCDCICHKNSCGLGTCRRNLLIFLSSIFFICRGLLLAGAPGCPDKIFLLSYK